MENLTVFQRLAKNDALVITAILATGLYASGIHLRSITLMTTAMVFLAVFIASSRLKVLKADENHTAKYMAESAEIAKQTLHNFDALAYGYGDSTGLRIIGKKLTIVTSRSDYDRFRIFPFTQENLCLSENKRWVLLTITRAHQDAYCEGEVISESEAKKRLLHLRELYVKHFGEPELV